MAVTVNKQWNSGLMVNHRSPPSPYPPSRPGLLLGHKLLPSCIHSLIHICSSRAHTYITRSIPLVPTNRRPMYSTLSFRTILNPGLDWYPRGWVMPFVLPFPCFPLLPACTWLCPMEWLGHPSIQIKPVFYADESILRRYDVACLTSPLTCSDSPGDLKHGSIKEGKRRTEVEIVYGSCSH